MTNASNKTLSNAFEALIEIKLFVPLNVQLLIGGSLSKRFAKRDGLSIN